MNAFQVMFYGDGEILSKLLLLLGAHRKFLESAASLPRGSLRPTKLTAAEALEIWSVKSCDIPTVQPSWTKTREGLGN